MTFRVGQRVVCVDARHRLVRVATLTERRVYTIRDVGEEKHYPGEFWVYLEEIHNQLMWKDGTELGYDATRFRPIVERKTSIKVFQRMLNPSEVEA